MNLEEKIVRILQTRKGTRPGNFPYGSRVYLLRDKKLTPTTVLMFAKYCKEDIELSDSTISISKVKLINVLGDKFVAQITVNNISIEVTA